MPVSHIGKKSQIMKWDLRGDPVCVCECVCECVCLTKDCKELSAFKVWGEAVMGSMGGHGCSILVATLISGNVFPGCKCPTRKINFIVPYTHHIETAERSSNLYNLITPFWSCQI